MKLGSAIRLRLMAVGLAGIASFSGATPTSAQGANSVLVSPDRLVANIARTDVRLIDLGKRAEEFEAAHLPNAQFVDWRTDLADPDNRGHFGVLQPDAFEALMSRLGLERGAVLRIGLNTVEAAFLDAAVKMDLTASMQRAAASFGVEP